MLSEADPSSAFWTIASLVILFGMIPGILFLLGRAATAGTQPDSEQMDEVRQLAVQINQASEDLLTEATHAFAGTPGERRALDSLIRFADTAETFRIIILSPVRSPGRARRSFRDLTTDFDLARLAFPALKAYRAGREGMEKMERLVEKLKILYDARPSRATLRQSTAVPAARKPESHNENLKSP